MAYNGNQTPLRIKVFLYHNYKTYRDTEAKRVYKNKNYTVANFCKLLGDCDGYLLSLPNIQKIKFEFSTLDAKKVGTWFRDEKVELEEALISGKFEGCKNYDATRFTNLGEFSYKFDSTDLNKYLFGDTSTKLWRNGLDKTKYQSIQNNNKKVVAKQLKRVIEKLVADVEVRVNKEAQAQTEHIIDSAEESVGDVEECYDFDVVDDASAEDVVGAVDEGRANEEAQQIISTTEAQHIKDAINTLNSILQRSSQSHHTNNWGLYFVCSENVSVSSTNTGVMKMDEVAFEIHLGTLQQMLGKEAYESGLSFRGNRTNRPIRGIIHSTPVAMCISNRSLVEVAEEFIETQKPMLSKLPQPVKVNGSKFFLF